MEEISAIQTVQVHKYTHKCSGCASKYVRDISFHITILCTGGSYPKKDHGFCPCSDCLIKVSCKVVCKKLEDFVDEYLTHEALKGSIKEGKKKEAFLWSVIG